MKEANAKQAKPRQYFWIGLSLSHSPSTASRVVWKDGTPVDYGNPVAVAGKSPSGSNPPWSFNQPNNAMGGNQECAIMLGFDSPGDKYSLGEWQDMRCDSSDLKQYNWWGGEPRAGYICSVELGG